jgi:hypothetical protein
MHLPKPDSKAKRKLKVAAKTQLEIDTVLF